ncbi:MAG: HAD family hydrolase [Gammaproteobacteria bacterium]|nr:HAD family hydrolase [Gammaproteobacteria bacterium]
MDTVRAITFDLDDTLWDNRPVLLAAEAALHAWLEAHYPRITARHSVESLRAERLALAEREPRLRHHMTALRKASLAAAAAAAGYPAEPTAAAAFEVFLAARQRVTPYPDVVPAILRLRAAGLVVGALTNGNADVRRIGLGHLFAFALQAEEVGAPKPHPRLFEAACERAGVAPGALLHVGDEPETDIAGARAAGVRAVWMNRLGHPPPAEHRPDAEVRDMDGLLELLGLR